MKKLLAMVLALVMTLSLAVSANAAFKDPTRTSAMITLRPLPS